MPNFSILSLKTGAQILHQEKRKLYWLVFRFQVDNYYYCCFKTVILFFQNQRILVTWTFIAGVQRVYLFPICMLEHRLWSQNAVASLLPIAFFFLLNHCDHTSSLSNLIPPVHLGSVRIILLTIRPQVVTLTSINAAVRVVFFPLIFLCCMINLKQYWLLYSIKDHPKSNRKMILVTT